MFFLRYLNEKKHTLILFLLFAVIFTVVFALYSLPLEAVFYPVLLCAVVGAGYIILDFRRAWLKHKALTFMKDHIYNVNELLPKPSGIDDNDYQDIIRRISEQNASIISAADARYADTVDYYTVWAHQIKTPIASMRLTLSGEDSELSRGLYEDLFRIEQYVEMAMTFLRLDSSSTDYVFREYDLDPIIRSSVKKFSTQFIRRKLTLEYEPTNIRVITDEKWLSFVIEQVLSNAIKYTQNGGVTICVEAPAKLTISDTGIGIAPDDLPRIFEKGYTGYNGRADKKASGIGLYLCRRICKNLGHTITASSCVGEGTKVTIDLIRDKRQTE